MSGETKLAETLKNLTDTVEEIRGRIIDLETDIQKITWIVEAIKDKR